jgi:hypothetical protein
MREPVRTDRCEWFEIETTAPGSATTAREMTQFFPSILLEAGSDIDDIAANADRTPDIPLLAETTSPT